MDKNKKNSMSKSEFDRNINKALERRYGKNSEITDSEVSNRLTKADRYIKKLSSKQRDKILSLLRAVHEVQKSDMTTGEKAHEIKKILWTNQSTESKLFIGGALGTVIGLLVFGTGGIGIVGLGGGIGVWGFLAGTTGGVLVASLIENFENENKNGM